MTQTNINICYQDQEAIFLNYCVTNMMLVKPAINFHISWISVK